MLLNKVMGNFSACGSQAEPLLAEGSEMSPLTWMEKEKKKKQTRTTTQNTYNIYYVFKLDVWIVSTDLGSVCVCGGGGGQPSSEQMAQSRTVHGVIRPAISFNLSWLCLPPTRLCQFLLTFQCDRRSC